MTVLQFRKRLAQTQTQNSSPLFVSPPFGVRAIGIDLGTTNSVVSVYSPNESEPETLLYNDMPLVPSLLYFNPQTGGEVVGAPAAAMLQENPANVVRSTKRSMGSIAQNFTSNGKTYSPEDAATLVLQHLASHPVLQREREMHGGVWAVITVPAHFDDAARQATVQAAARAGIHVLRIVNEPTAAALAYSMLPDVRNEQKETLAVFDFGGGTFDVSIVQRQGLVFNVLSSEGDVYLGGDDIDIALAASLLKKVSPYITARRTKPESPLFKKLVTIAEDAKIALESRGLYSISEPTLAEGGVSLETSLSREELNGIAEPFVARTLELTERAIHAARCRVQQVSRILLVGGSTRLGLVRNMLESYFPNSIVDARIEPDLAVSWGAAAQAAIILGIEPNTILVDVCSHSLGIGVAEDSNTVNQNFKKVARKFGILHPTPGMHLESVLGDRVEDFHKELQNTLRVATIIHRNSPLPSRKSEFFNTLYSNQLAVHVVVVQGESPTVGENKLIGSFLFDLEQPCPKGSRCEIQLTYDVNGMVHVLAKQLDTTNEAEAQFDSRTGEVVGWRKTSTNNTAQTLEGMLNPSQFASDSQSDLLEPTPVLNTIIAQARRFLAKSHDHTRHRDTVSALLATYEKLLAEAKIGAANDTEIDFVEDRLLQTLHEAAHHHE